MKNESTEFKVAICSEFLTAFMRLPRQEQGKVSAFLEKFKSNPRSPGINYEKISGARDSNLRSVRIDLDYRGIVLKPESENVYMMLWVDKHDDAYDWASKRSFKINSHTGGLQMIFAEEGQESTASKQPGKKPAAGLFKDIKDKHLLRLGVPEELLPVARGIGTDEDLDRNAKLFPQEASEALYYLAAGFSLQDTFNALNRDPDSDSKVNTEDFAKALENEDTMRRFHVITDSIELAEILKAPMDLWRVFLHPSQRRIVELDASGPVRVLGGAGTGKTVVAMHRAKYLAEKVFNRQGERILFTTFTKNLAEDIKSNLKKICSLEALSRIDVINIDAWVSQFLRKNEYKYNIIFSRNRDDWREALTLSGVELNFELPFYEQEWEFVVQENGIGTETEYLNVPRLGRGIRLNRLQRKEIWKVFEEYRSILNRNNQKELSDAVRDARVILESKGDILSYGAVIVDEAQDMSPEVFKLIRQIINPKRAGLRNDIFIVGDAHQRLYAHKVVLSKCGINIRGRSKKLYLNYRTTDEIRRWAVALLEDREIDDLDGAADNNKGYKSLIHGSYPEVRTFKGFEEEADFIAAQIKETVKSGININSICLCARTENQLQGYEKALGASDIKTVWIKHNVSDDSSHEGVRLATMHRVKGLEFDIVFAAGVNRGFVPSDEVLAECDEDYIKYETETKERSLLYVAVTRARKHVIITSYGKSSILIKGKDK
ncbi:MAG: 3'-5' exonuclease [Victivallales bacterium]